MANRSDNKTEERPELERVLRNFVACDRCSFFLAGYRVIHGLEELERAAQEQSDQWLDLSWNDETRRLLQKSYGGRLDIDLYYYDSQCPVCRRRFTYQAATPQGKAEAFRIETK